MKILIVNYRYFISGGAEKYMFNVISLLRSKGHTVMPFSNRNIKNEITPYERYFVDGIDDNEKVYYREYKKSIGTIRQLLARSIYSFEVKKALVKMINAEKPDVVYVLHHVNKLSPSVISACRKTNIRIVMRLSDYFLMCPSFHFLSKNQVCEDCVNYGLRKAVLKRCVQNSYPASLVRVIAMKLHRFIKIYEKVDCFITPSSFLKEKLIRSGYDQNRIKHIPTFINCQGIAPKYNGDYLLYYGRISKEKGIEYLIRAFSNITDIDIKLLIAGNDKTPEAEFLKNFIKKNEVKNIIFTGFLEGTDLTETIQNSKCVIVPSIWYDNLPNVILESFSVGKPVIASNIGTLPESVIDSVNGYLFEPGNDKDLEKKLRKLLMKKSEIIRLGANARTAAETIYNPDNHYRRLMEALKPN